MYRYTGLYHAQSMMHKSTLCCQVLHINNGLDPLPTHVRLPFTAESLSISEYFRVNESSSRLLTWHRTMGCLQRRVVSYNRLCRCIGGWPYTTYTHCVWLHTDVGLGCQELTTQRHRMDLCHHDGGRIQGQGRGLVVPGQECVYCDVWWRQASMYGYMYGQATRIDQYLILMMNTALLNDYTRYKRAWKYVNNKTYFEIKIFIPFSQPSISLFFPFIDVI